MNYVNKRLIKVTEVIRLHPNNYRGTGLSIYIERKEQYTIYTLTVRRRMLFGAHIVFSAVRRWDSCNVGERQRACCLRYGEMYWSNAGWQTNPVRHYSDDTGYCSAQCEVRNRDK